MKALRATTALFAAVGFATCAAQNVASGGAGTSAAEAKDMALVGYHDLQARSAYQPVVQEQNGRWIAYIGHHGGTEKVAKPVNALTGKPEFNGTSVLDVTDPRAPRYLAHIPGEEGQGESGGAQMVRVCAGKDLPKGNDLLKGDPGKFYLVAHLRQFRARNLGCDRSREARTSVAHRSAQGHAQELVGVRHGYRLPRFRRRRLADAPHDADLRSERSGASAFSSAISASQVSSPAAPETRRLSCTARSRPARRRTGCTSATAPTRTASCRSSIGRNF